jgi:hypothetical protein
MSRLHWRRQQRTHSAVTPADAADLEAARVARERIEQEREQVERAIESGRSRWPLILATVARLREIREENHLADDLHVIFTGHRRG